MVKTLLGGIINEVNHRGLLRDEQLGFRPRHGEKKNVAGPARRKNQEDFDESEIIGAGCLDVAKAFNSEWLVMNS